MSFPGVLGLCRWNQYAHMDPNLRSETQWTSQTHDGGEEDRAVVLFPKELDLERSLVGILEHRWDDVPFIESVDVGTGCALTACRSVV